MDHFGFGLIVFFALVISSGKLLRKLRRNPVVLITINVSDNLLFFIFLLIGEAIKCYVCNSAIDSACASNQTLNKAFLKDCSELAGGAKNTVCRKIDQDAPNHNGSNPQLKITHYRNRLKHTSYIIHYFLFTQSSTTPE